MSTVLFFAFFTGVFIAARVAEKEIEDISG